MDVILEYVMHEHEHGTLYDSSHKDISYLYRGANFLEDVQDIAGRTCGSDERIAFPYKFEEKYGSPVRSIGFEPVVDSQGVRVHYQGDEAGLDAFVSRMNDYGYGTPERVHNGTTLHPFDSREAKKVVDRYKEESRRAHVGTSECRDDGDEVVMCKEFNVYC